jgi:hypothetical protein
VALSLDQQKMKSILTTVIALGLAVFSALAQTPGLTINTPAAVVQCQPALLSWSADGSNPYSLTILSSDLVTILFQFPTTNATSVTWLVDMTAGTRIALRIADSLGQSSESAIFAIQANTASANATACIGSASFSFLGTSPVSTGTATVQNPSGATTTSPSTGNTATTNSGSAATARSSAGGTATGSSSTTTRSAGASRVTGQIAAAGIIGAAMVALLG